MSTPPIVVEGAGKRFLRHDRKTARTWRGWFSRPWQRAKSEPFWALRDVSFAVEPGEALGVIGPNGAGKSTLLCLLSGIGIPTTGRVNVEGRIAGLLELGGGFAGDLTGRENAVLAGVVAGLTRTEVLSRLDRIVDFADIGDVLDEPVRTYSTGMRMRLAFAVVVHTDPDVLLVDEFLAVGDLGFQSRCHARITELRNAGCAVVAVSHSMNEVRELCDRVLWLRDGVVAALDTPESVTTLYEEEMRNKSLQRTPATIDRLPDGRTVRAKKNRLGSLEMEITAVNLLPRANIRSGDPLKIEIGYVARQRVKAPVFGVSITREDGTLCLDTNTQAARISTDQLESEGRINMTISRLDLGTGRYFVNVGIFESQWSHAYDYHWQLYPLIVDGKPEHKGLLAPPCRWESDASVAVRAAPAADFVVR